MITAVPSPSKPLFWRTMLLGDKTLVIPRFRKIQALVAVRFVEGEDPTVVAVGAYDEAGPVDIRPIKDGYVLWTRLEHLDEHQYEELRNTGKLRYHVYDKDSVVDFRLIPA